MLYYRGVFKEEFMSEQIKLSEHVSFFRDHEGESFVVTARPVDEKSKYVIELESIDVWETIMDQSFLRYGFWGRYTNFQERVDKKSKKVYVNITFQLDVWARDCSLLPGPEMLKKEDDGPAFTLEMSKEYENLMRNVFKQLNAQALKMEANQKETNTTIGVGN